MVNIQSDLFWHRCLERQTFDTPRMYALYLSKSIKRSHYGEFLKVKNVLLMYTTVLSLTAYKYAPNLESLVTQQYVCVMCTLWSDNTCVFTRFHSVKNANTRLIWSYVTPQCKSLNNTGDCCPRYAKPSSQFGLFNSILKRFHNQLFNIWS